MNYKHSTIPAVRSVPVSVPLVNSSTSAAIARNKSHRRQCLYVYIGSFNVSSLVVFYNIYLHPDRTDLGIGIVKEQLGQVAKSTLHSHTRNEND
jgi:hypothetical protein